MKLAVVVANLGGPDCPEAVKPFLFNLFNDRFILGLPQPGRYLLAKLLAARRAPIASHVYARIGGRSPILSETLAQAALLERMLAEKAGAAMETRVFTAMRYWHPFVAETVQAVKAWGPDRIVLLPLYPQFSTTTTQSFFEAWDSAATMVHLTARTSRLCCHPTDPDFIAAHVSLIRNALAPLSLAAPMRLLFSAHGLPKRIVAKGDPYQWQVEQTVRAIVTALAIPALDHKICYQSRVGPLQWLEPSTDEEIRRAGAAKAAVILVPIAFVSEHSETLVELDMDYAEIAETSGVTQYVRVPALSVTQPYIEGLAKLAFEASKADGIVSAGGQRICPRAWGLCPHP